IRVLLSCRSCHSRTAVYQAVGDRPAPCGICRFIFLRSLKQRSFVMYSPLRHSRTPRRVGPFAGQRPTARLYLERLEDRWAPALSWHGGPVIANVQVEVMYYSPWNTNPTLQSQKTTLDSYFTSVTNSTYLDLLAQYSAGGTTIGRGVLKADDAHFATAVTHSLL